MFYLQLNRAFTPLRPCLSLTLPLWYRLGVVKRLGGDADRTADLKRPKETKEKFPTIIITEHHAQPQNSGWWLFSKVAVFWRLAGHRSIGGKW